MIPDISLESTNLPWRQSAAISFVRTQCVIVSGDFKGDRHAHRFCEERTGETWLGCLTKHRPTEIDQTLGLNVCQNIELTQLESAFGFRQLSKKTRTEEAHRHGHRSATTKQERTAWRIKIDMPHRLERFSLPAYGRITRRAQRIAQRHFGGRYPIDRLAVRHAVGRHELNAALRRHAAQEPPIHATEIGRIKGSRGNWLRKGVHLSSSDF
jgi:hypothetical protein